MKKLTTIYMNKALVSFNNINSLTSKNETSKEKKFKTRHFSLILNSKVVIGTKGNYIFQILLKGLYQKVRKLRFYRSTNKIFLKEDL